MNFLESIKDGIHEIKPYLFLTGFVGARNIEGLKSLGITLVISVDEKPPDCLDRYANNDIQQVTVLLLDWVNENLIPVAKHVHEIICNVRDKGGKVLIHCVQGKSRSAACVIFHLLHHKDHQHQSVYEVFLFVQSIRMIVQPNDGFIQQLVEYKKNMKTNTNKIESK